MKVMITTDNETNTTSQINLMSDSLLISYVTSSMFEEELGEGEVEWTLKAKIRKAE